MLVRALLASMLALTVVPALSQNQTPIRKIENVAGDVYRFQNNFHFSLVVMTSAGVVVSDPINTEAAAWLKAELATMTDMPVTHLIYSHSHLDHASGGAVFEDTATVIAQTNAPDAIDGVAPDIRFGDRMEMTVGAHRFEMTWLGAGHGQDLIATVVRPENVAFIVDAAAPKRLPFRDFPGSDIDGWINQIVAASALDFEIFAPGHGGVGTKQDLADAETYMRDLRIAVLDGLKAGKDAETLKAEVTMDAYKDWGQYDAWRELNVIGMARYLMATGQVE